MRSLLLIVCDTSQTCLFTMLVLILADAVQSCPKAANTGTKSSLRLAAKHEEYSLWFETILTYVIECLACFRYGQIQVV